MLHHEHHAPAVHRELQNEPWRKCGGGRAGSFQILVCTAFMAAALGLVACEAKTEVGPGSVDAAQTSANDSLPSGKSYGDPDYAGYLMHNPDVQQAWDRDVQLRKRLSNDPLSWAKKHYELHGKAEGRLMPVFEPPPPPPPPAFVLWGDSLVAGVGSSHSRETVAGQLVEDFPEYKFTAIGMPGSPSNEVLKRQAVYSGQYRGAAGIIWLGRNNFGDTEQVLSDVNSAAAFHTSGKALILSVLNAAGEGAGTQFHSAIVRLNRKLEEAFPEAFIDVRKMLVAAYDPSNPQDVADHEADIVPTSLRSDAIHLNAKGYAIVADAIGEAIRAKGW